MNTYGLNRHLNSFGLSYPGYWFIIIDEPGGSIPYIAYGDTGYIARELERLYPAHSITLYEARTGGIALVTREFAATENRNYSTKAVLRTLEAWESIRFLAAEEDQRYFIAYADTDFTASEIDRAFIAIGQRQYDIRSS